MELDPDQPLPVETTVYYVLEARIEGRTRIHDLLSSCFTELSEARAAKARLIQSGHPDCYIMEGMRL